MSQSACAKNWCFTLNNPSTEELSHFKNLFELDIVNYIVFQLEQASTGTPHLQGYIQLGTKKRFNPTKALLSPRVHLSKALGTPEENRAYCTKEPRLTPFIEHGIISVAGKRNDIEEFVSDMREADLDDVALLERHPRIMAKYPRFVVTTRRILREAQLTYAPFVPNSTWQQSLVTCLDNQPDPRQVKWYFDERGSAGKSYFCRHFRLRDGGRPFVITGGKHTDIYYAYQRQRAVFFDIPRCTDPASFPYAVAESFKNGYFLSTKYESTPIYFDPPHVVIFSNFYPDKTKLSMDRWDIHIIDNSLLLNTLS